MKLDWEKTSEIEQMLAGTWQEVSRELPHSISSRITENLQAVHTIVENWKLQHEQQGNS